jgi:methyltransferase family protein
VRHRRLDHLVAAETVARRVRELDGATLLDAGRPVGDLLGGRWSVTALGARDLRALEHPDDAFDVVVCLDVLERVPWRDRPRALHELARVARRHVVVAAALPALDLAVPLRAWAVARPGACGAGEALPGGPLAAALLGAGLHGPRARALAARLSPAYRALVVAEIAASISPSSSCASAS